MNEFMSISPKGNNQIDKKRVVRNAGIARLAKFIEKHLYSTDWTIIADMASVGHILDEPRHERVRRAQGFGDPDYPEAISRFLKEVFDTDEQIGLFLVHEIANQENPYDDELSKDAKEKLVQILSMFGSENLDFTASISTSVEIDKFIDPIWIPDNFYEKLIGEINQVYAYQQPMALSVLIRKLLENLVIDVLRKKYGTADLELYYDPSKRRFNDFAVLLKNLDSKKADFHYITSSLDKSFISDIDKYRETGNSGAHSIDANLSIEEFKTNKEKINYLVELLLKVYQRI